jgi:DNA-binding MarR family transcriptional regulator
LAPTQAGESAYRHAQHVVKVNEAALLSHLSAEEQDTLISLLRKIRQVED